MKIGTRNNMRKFDKTHNKSNSHVYFYCEMENILETQCERGKLWQAQISELI